MVKKTPGVAFYGKVRIPTIGHAEAINTAKSIAKKRGARLTIGLSHTNAPLNSSQKRVHAEKVFNHPVMTGDEHTKNLFSFLSHLNKSHDELHLVAGSDRAEQYRSTLQQYNGRADKSGKVPFHFKSWKVHEVEGERGDSGKDPTKMSRDELVRSVSASKLEKLASEGNYEHFKAYHPGMPESHVKKVYGQIRKGLSLNEEVTRKELAPMLDSFVSFASDKLGLKSMPTVRYKTDDDDYNSFAAYNPSSNELSVSTINRHPMDIFRSVAHELVHHKQNEDGRIGKDIAKEGETGSDIENEANAEAGKIMRWFAKSNPDMFAKSFVVETNTAAMAPVSGIRGLGNVTGEVSPTGTSQYVIANQTYTQNAQGGNNTDGLWYDDGIDSYWLDKKGSGEYQKKAVKGFKAVRGQLNEGINDPGRLKAVFLAGGPGSGKDFVMNKALAGNGLREINSDTAFEYLMKKNGLDLEMPDEERVEREVVRGRAKNITSTKEINSLSGRLGLIVNGTADDLEKIKTVKSELEDLGYDTMMVFVNTSNEVSRQRNVERGKSGNRKVPDGTDKQGNPDGSPNIRQEKWDLAQKNIGELEKIFGKDSFTVIDNTADIRKVAPDVKDRIEADFNRVRRMTMQFVQSPVKNKRGQAWTQRRARYQGTTQYTPPTAYTKVPTPTRIETPKAIIKPSSEVMDQARRLGLSYYGFGRFGRKVGGKNKVMYHSKGNQLVKVQINEDLRQWFSKDHPKGNWKRVDTKGNIKGDCAREPGEGKPKCMPASRAYSMSKEDRAKSARRKRREDPVANRPGKGNKPINVKTESVQKAIDKIKADRISEQVLIEKNVPTNPELWSKAKSLAKSKFDVYPSAYANGWASKWYKSKGGGWKTATNEACWDGYEQKGMKKKGGRSVPNCVPANEAFEQFMQSMGNKPSTEKKKPKKKALNQEALTAPEPWGYNFGGDGIGPTYAVPRAGTPFGFGYGSAYSAGISESIQTWMNSEKTQQKFANKYGDLWEEKLTEAALRLEEAGCGCDHSEKKSIKKLREGMEGGVNNMSMIPTQRKSEEQLNEKGADSKGLYRSTESGAGLTRKGAKHFGVKTAVTTPPSKLKRGGKAWKRRKSFCARMGGVVRRSKNAERARASMRRWNCEE